MFYILGVFFKVGRQSVGESVIKGPDEIKNDVDARKRYDSMEEYLTRGTRVLLMSKAWAVSYCTSGFFCGIRLFFLTTYFIFVTCGGKGGMPSMLLGTPL